MLSTRDSPCLLWSPKSNVFASGSYCAGFMCLFFACCCLNVWGVVKLENSTQRYVGQVGVTILPIIFKRIPLLLSSVNQVASNSVRCCEGCYNNQFRISNQYNHTWRSTDSWYWLTEQSQGPKRFRSDHLLAEKTTFADLCTFKFVSAVGLLGQDLAASWETLCRINPGRPLGSHSLCSDGASLTPLHQASSLSRFGLRNWSKFTCPV